VGDGKSIAHYLKNEIVFSQGGVADAVFYIQKGNVKLVVVSKHGKEAVVAILGPGHFFGEGCLNGHPLRIATARAVDECVVTRLEKTTMIGHGSQRTGIFRTVHALSSDPATVGLKKT
jgi:CRP-like cAMP-binding protein